MSAPRVPPRLVASARPRHAEEIESVLSARSGHPVRIQVGRRGEFARALEVAEQNAHLILEEEELKAAQKGTRVDHSVYALQEALGLAAPPYRIEGYDISNIQAAHPVASLVVFQDGKALKSAYRRFRMSRTKGPDDFAMMGEVLRRRLERLQSREATPPDLILVDGGKGQVERARETCELMGYPDLPLIGLAKREEEIVMPRVPEPLRLARSSEALRLLQRVRDEAHRFAVKYHRGLRRRAQRRSRLDQIRGIGPARRQALLHRFGSLEGIRQAGFEALAELPGFGPKLARALWEALHGSAEDEGAKSGSGATSI